MITAIYMGLRGALGSGKKPSWEMRDIGLRQKKTKWFKVLRKPSASSVQKFL